MGRNILRWITIILFAASGVGALAGAVLAYELGLDNDPAWGFFRIFLAFTGFILLFVSWLVQHYGLVKSFYKKTFVQETHKTDLLAINIQATAAEAIVEQDVRDIHANARSSGYWAILGCVLVILAAGWFINIGRASSWAPSTSYFDKLADAFLSGSLSLLDQPPNELLALPDPYDWRAREGLDYLWDTSLFDGKYYLYFGPVPALLIMPLKAFLPVVVGDNHILMFFYAAYIITSAVMLHWMRKTWFEQTPTWTVFLFVLLSGLSTHVLWLAQAHYVYETSIMGGQFFLLLGVYACLRGMASKNKVLSWSLLCGFAWGASVGCRLNYAAGVGMMVLLVGIFLINKKSRSWHPWAGALVVLIICGLCLAYYNTARFGSPLSTGHQYQLTGPAYQADLRNIFSLKYLPPNLYNLLLRPPAISIDKYPYVIAPFIREDMWPWFIRLPDTYYYSEPIISLLAGIPALILLALPLVGAMWAFNGWLNEHNGQSMPRANSQERMALFILWAGVLGNGATIATYVAATMRYGADIAPLLIIILSIVGWGAIRALQNRPVLQRVYIFFLGALCLASILLGVWINYHAV